MFGATDDPYRRETNFSHNKNAASRELARLRDKHPLVCSRKSICKCGTRRVLEIHQRFQYHSDILVMLDFVQANRICLSRLSVTYKLAMGERKRLSTMIRVKNWMKDRRIFKKKGEATF